LAILLRSARPAEFSNPVVLKEAARHRQINIPLAQAGHHPHQQSLVTVNPSVFTILMIPFRQAAISTEYRHSAGRAALTVEAVGNMGELNIAPEPPSPVHVRGRVHLTRAGRNYDFGLSVPHSTGRRAAGSLASCKRLAVANVL
jgi:hypothetical protein